MSRFTRILLAVLLSMAVVMSVLWVYLNYDPEHIEVKITDLEHHSSTEIKTKVSSADSILKNIIVKDGKFLDTEGRTLFLRGINLGGSNKVPFTPNMGSHVREGFFDGVNLSFVGRPFPLKDADKHFNRLKVWGFNFIRFLVTWEAIEHKGPGIYDEDYLNYVRAIIQKAAEYNIRVFIDPHQDLWSRFSGGDGAPLWTFEVAKLNVKNFKETGAAFVHNVYGDPYPKMVWFTNYYKLASATMFSLFYAGNDFAPHVLVNNSIPVQDFLQSHYINAMVRVAEKVKDLPNVIGFELMNEPSSGYIGIKDLSKPFETSVLGKAPTPWQGMLLGDGIPQKVKRYELGIIGLKDMGEEPVNTQKKSAWLHAGGDIWKQEGVWKRTGNSEPILLKPGYFTKINGRKVDFNRDYYLPFADKYEKAIHKINPNWLIFVDNVLFPIPHKLPNLKSLGNKKWVNASHWYDDATLVTKQYTPWIGFLNDKIILGKRNVRIAFEGFMNHMINDTKIYYGDQAASILGEFGIPFDMNEGAAYHSGDFSQQTAALDRSMRLLEKKRLSYTLWNYTADNSNERGDQWNGEDLSVFSPDQQKDTNDINSGGRALKAVIRPFPSKISGVLTQYFFDMKKGELILKFIPDKNISKPTNIILPRYHFGKGFDVYTTGGDLSYDRSENTLFYSPKDFDKEQVIVIRKK